MATVKKVYQAVAGSGKTQYIIDELNKTDRILILTFTNNNEQSIKNRIINKYGSIPENIHVYKILTFIYNFCLLPYFTTRPKGIIFDNELLKRNTRIQNYKLGKYLYSNQITRLIIDKKIPYIDRLNIFFDTIYIDEFQDIASDELDWTLSLHEFNGDVVLLGDFYQKTYTTSNRGNKSINKLKTYEKFKETYEQGGFEFDESSFLKSKRCSLEVCDFVSEKLGIPMESANKEDDFVIDVTNDKEKISDIFTDTSITKLYFSKSYEYKGNSMNWGNSKGLTLGNIAIVLNKSTLKKFEADKLHELAPRTLYKFYVACTRATKNVYFISYKDVPEEYKEN